MSHSTTQIPEMDDHGADVWRTARGALVVLVVVFLGVHGLRACLDTLAPPPPALSAASITTTSAAPR